MRKDKGSGLPVSPWEDAIMVCLWIFAVFTLVRVVW
jgi:hypothetical protein